MSNGSGLFDLNLSEWVALIAVLAGVVAAIWRLRLWLRDRRRLLNTFALSIPPELHAHGSTHDHAGRSQVGRHHMLLAVQVAYPLEVTTFNLRFVASKEGGNVSEAVIAIAELRDPEAAALHQLGQRLSSEPDGEGGVDGYYLPARRKYRGEYLWFEIWLEASGPWTGFLSFKGYDKTGQQRMSRIPFTVSGGVA